MTKKIYMWSSAAIAVVVLSGCFGQKNVDIQTDTQIEKNVQRDGTLRNDVEKKMIPVEPDGGIGDGAMPLPEHGDDVDVFSGVAAAPLKDVSGGNAVGSASTVTKEGETHHRMIAQNLPATTNGDFYEGWIVSSPIAPGGVVSTGVMTQQKDGTWLLEYVSDKELPNHKTVVLTLEPDDGDPAPAKHILEGKTQ